MKKFSESSEDLQSLEKADDLLSTLAPLRLQPNLWNAQNIYFGVTKQSHESMKERAAKGDDYASRWVERFVRLGEKLKVKAG
jgi:hypothetical protein